MEEKFQSINFFLVEKIEVYTKVLWENLPKIVIFLKMQAILLTK